MYRHSPFLRLYLILLMLSSFAVALAAKTVLLDDSDNSTHMCLNVGDTISIKLKSNITTGYSWEATSVPSCLLRGESKQEQKSNPRMGESGFQIFAFKAKDTCNAVVAFKYFRSFEKENPLHKPTRSRSPSSSGREIRPAVITFRRERNISCRGYVRY